MSKLFDLNDIPNYSKRHFEVLELEITHSGLLAKLIEIEGLRKSGALHDDKYLGALSEAVDLYNEILMCLDIGRQVQILNRIHILYKLNPVGGGGNGYIAYIFKMASRDRGKYNLSKMDDFTYWKAITAKKEDTSAWFFRSEDNLLKDLESYPDQLRPRHLVKLKLFPHLDAVYKLRNEEWRIPRIEEEKLVFYDKKTVIDWIKTNYQGFSFRSYIGRLKKFND